ncbi:sensor histidine kinase [Streptomyces seoulensis]|uniref:sensor histidine kinase n=1 Tax=Streptomyces seoulensis TaxID=73044 RepID=UPI001FCB8C08|nr:ATP-binding protein [Streptomyces seoulensis]BDH07142.1 histidine kinase [Streptomyces seoulensis]
MSDRASPSRSAAHGRRRRHPSNIERLLLSEVRSAVIVTFAGPVMVVLVLAAVLRLAAGIPGDLLAYGVVVALLGIVAVAVRRTRSIANTVGEAWSAAQEADAQEYAEEFRRIQQGVAAVGQAVSWSAEELCRGGMPPVPDTEHVEVGAAGVVLQALGRLQADAVKGLLRVRTEARSEVDLALLRQLAKREHVQVGRALDALQALEGLTDDPELLEKIWRIDHQVTMVRRHVESMAVLGGESLRSGRRSPVSVIATVRGAIGEVVGYERCTAITPSVPADLAMPGYVGRDVAHVLAELIDNSLACSPPSTRVEVAVQPVPNGLAFEVVDRAIPMDPRLREHLNQLLDNPETVDFSRQVRGGQIGLPTAARIGQRHGLSIRLSENSTGGTTALVVVPTTHLIKLPEATAPSADVPAPSSPAPQAPVRLLERGHQHHGTAPENTAAGAAGGPAGAPLLPRRIPQQSTEFERPEAPASVKANPQLGAAFRAGARSARNAEAQADSAPASWDQGALPQPAPGGGP